MKRASALLAAALALPLVGLGYTWLSADMLSRQGTDWQVPVRGYDPHDILRGHYVQFTYDWPRKPSDDDDYSPIRALCLEGSGGVVTRAVKVDPDKARCPNLARDGADSGNRSGMWALEQGRLYASGEEAMRLQTALADRKQQGMLTFRLRPDGHVTPLRITFRPRTPAELKAMEDAEAEIDADRQATIDEATRTPSSSPTPARPER